MGDCMKTIMVPGEQLSAQARQPRSSYRENGRSYASTLSILDSERKTVIPLEGAWTPMVEDLVVGIVKDCRNHVYVVDLLHFARGLIIGSKFDRSSFSKGDVVEATIKEVEDRKVVILDRAKALRDGIVVAVRPAKIPRIIGKADTMIRQISESTKTRISVGNNGLIWLSGPNAQLAMKAISIIERDAQASGLTSMIKSMLDKEMNEMESGNGSNPGV